MNCRISAAIVASVSLLAAACGGLSDVGHQDNAKAPPTAVAAVLNQPFTRDANGKVSTRVRSGTQVFLSGKDSDGAVAPILRFVWQQTSVSQVNRVTMVTRNANTVSFAAPMVPQDTQLHFQLTVTDANGSTDTRDVDVTVIAIADSNHFLSYDLTTSQQLRLAAITSRDVSPAELAAAGGQDVSFEITVRQLVDYTTPGVDGPYLPLSSKTLTGKWLASYGASHDCDAAVDSRNPLFQIDVPAVNLDDIIAAVDPADLAAKPNPALVDQYRLKAEVSIRVTGGALPGDVQPIVCAPDVAPPAAPAVLAKTTGLRAKRLSKETDTASGKLELTRDEMLGTASVTLDTPESTRAYYAAIDPQQQRTSLLDWLKVTGFVAGTSTSVSWADVAAGSSAHATYTNNFDLGFGRDMYARVGACSDGAAPQLGQPLDIARVGNCDISAVVINYASLEGASKKLNPVLAVAMEYAATAGSAGRRIVQFYTFAPDLASGQFLRVLSANLDGRGEKFMPQVCTVCHGGTPGGLDPGGAYRNGGDISATFLPWDLDAFLYADTQGANSDASYGDDTLRSGYTRAAQAEGLRKLNQVAYLTYRDATRPNRFLLERQLVEGWYGTQAGPPARAFASNDFNGQYTPPGWSPNGVDGMANTADDNPATATALYHDVFAHYCRACHVAHAPSANATGASLESIVDNGTTYNKCDNDSPATEPKWVGIPNQLPMACYRQFIESRNLAQRLSQGRMPFARLTMDRFWVGPSASAGSAGDDLYDHLAAVLATLPPDQRPTLTVPGTPSACFTGLADSVELGQEYPVDASCSMFPQHYHWTVQAPAGSAASIAFADSSSAVLRGVDVKGNYTLSLETAANVTQSMTVARTDRPIELGTIAPLQISPEAGQNTRDVPVAASGGDGTLTLASVTSADPNIAGAQILDAQTIRITGLNVSASPVAISYTVADSDNDSAGAQFNVGVKGGLSAGSFTSAPAAVRLTGTAGSTLSIQLVPQVTSVAGQALEFFVDTTSGLGGTVSVVQATGAVTYRPPPGRMSQFRTVGSPVVFTGNRSGHDSFHYTVRYRDDPTTTATGTVTVPIEGTAANNTSFTSLHSGATDS
ncbi:MAG TPA: hypothetical protein VKB34_11365, partial [Povalibacter sp.]|nr:hypothetical protein [Povalibacter sp.]